MSVGTDYLPVATAVGNNADTQANFSGSGYQADGFTDGTAIPAQANKCWRQSSMFAAALGMLIANTLQIYVSDDGNVTALVSLLNQTLSALITAGGSGTAAQIAAINAQITAINAQIATINSEISTIEGDITTIDGQISTIDGQITTINDNATALSGTVTGLGNKVNATFSVSTNTGHIIGGGPYTNETGFRMDVTVTGSHTSTGYLEALVNGVPVDYQSCNPADGETSYASVKFAVPPGATYQVETDVLTQTVWAEYTYTAL